jgi:DNA-binding beta-propeller fold protein YncE
MTPDIRKLTSTGLVTLAVLGAGLAFAGAPAIASLVIPFKEQLTGENTPQKSFGGGGPSSVAVDDKTGDLLVAGPEEGVQVFDASGAYVTTWTGFGGGAPSRVAVNNSTGDVYVLFRSGVTVENTEHDVIDELDASGGLVKQITGIPGALFSSSTEDIAVDQTTGDVYVVEDTNADAVVNVFDAAGEYQTQITDANLPFGSGMGNRDLAIAVDAKTGNLLVSSSLLGVVYVFDSAHAYVATWNGSNTPAGSFVRREQEEQFSVAADDATGDVLVSDSRHHVVDVFNSAGEYVVQITGTPNGPFGGSLGRVAVDQATGDEYVLAGGVVDVFGSGVVIPSAVPNVPSDVEATSAVLRGTVNPEGFDAHRVTFEYVGEPDYRQALEEEELTKTKGNPYSAGGKVAGSPGDAGAGITPIAVSATVTGLLPGSEYHYRVAAANANGVDESVDQRLITGPALGGGSASSVSQFAARLNATVEPGEVPTTYHFVYGTTTGYGSIAPVPDTGLPVARGEDAVSERVAGLRAGTTYHFAVVATSSAGTFIGPDETFTTPGIPVPGVSTGGVSGVSTGAAVLSGSIDPQGWDTTYYFQYGTTVSYGANWPTVPINMGALNGAQSVTIELQNLQPDTTYHYRLVASNGGGTSLGPDMTFTTGQYPVSAVAPVPVLNVSLGFFNPEVQASHAKTKKKPKPKKRSKPKKGPKGKKKGEKK